MGLDMYLSAERYLWSSEKPISDEVANLLGLQLDGDRMRITTIKAEAMYWRKANAIHRWFVENVQGGEDDCQSYEVGREQLLELRNLCAKLCEQKVEAMAEDALPTTEGFFFGSTEYDEWYWNDIENTVQGIDQALETFGDGWYFSYRSSW
jgi:hypothetical protein